MAKLTKFDRLTEIEGAIYLEMSPELLRYFCAHAPKYGENKKLPFEKIEDERYYKKKDLDDYDKYLREPWPKPEKAQRPSLPKKIREEIMFEASCGCAFCGYENAGEAAHIEPVSESCSHHPSNLIWLCPNHHTVVDDGLVISNVSMVAAKTLKRKLVDRSLRLWRQERALGSRIMALIATIETVTSLIQDASLLEAQKGLLALAAKDLGALQVASKQAANSAIDESDADAVSFKAFAEKLNSSTEKASAENLESLTSWEKEAELARAEYLTATGQIDCPLCEGGGRHNGFDCPVCNGEGTIPETERENVDLTSFQEVNCPACEGKGALRGECCPACRGDARIEKRYADRIDPREYELATCPLCEGSGRHDGDDCPVCGGEREIERRHADQLDLGEFETQVCELCKGSGQFDGFECRACGGEGQIPRHVHSRIDWEDFKLVTCPACDGSGRSEFGDCRFCGGNQEVFRRDADHYP